MTWSGFWWLVLLSPVIIDALVAVLFVVAPPDPSAGVAEFIIVGVVAAIFLAIAYAFRSLNITVDDRELTVGFPIYRERVPLDQVIACRRTAYRWWEFGGYGIRWGRRGKMLNIGGDGGRAVEITRAGRGTLLFSSRDPDAVCAAIRARRPDLTSA